MVARALLVISLLFQVVSCVTTSETVTKRREKGGVNPLLSVWKPFAPKRLQQVYDHTLVKFYRAHGDCQPECPKVDVWKYAYKPKLKPLLESEEPISTLRPYWRVPHEARVISIALFGDNPIYYNGLSEYIDSFAEIKHHNGLPEHIPWGYETFTVRVYVAKRNPALKAKLGSLKGETPDSFIEMLLDRGVEVAYVDNHMTSVSKDATFWRFMITAEKMPKGQKIRYLLRDADWVLTAGEVFSVGEWVGSDLKFHRAHLVNMCIGPLTAMVWGGMHEGNAGMTDMKQFIEYFPYRYDYGDDELFSRDVIWPKILNSGSVMTHMYKRGFKAALSMPYSGSCEEPTQAYCDAMGPDGNCPDIEMPKEIEFPEARLGFRAGLQFFKDEMPEVFNLHRELERSKRVLKNFSGPLPL